MIIFIISFLLSLFGVLFLLYREKVSNKLMKYKIYSENWSESFLVKKIQILAISGILIGLLMFMMALYINNF